MCQISSWPTAQPQAPQLERLKDKQGINVNTAGRTWKVTPISGQKKARLVHHATKTEASFLFTAVHSVFRHVTFSDERNGKQNAEFKRIRYVVNHHTSAFISKSPSMEVNTGHVG